jgi:hypothetical protein
MQVRGDPLPFLQRAHLPQRLLGLLARRDEYRIHSTLPYTGRRART